jgi:hypothetical protein
VAFSPDGWWLATSWTDAKIRLWPLPGTGGREPRVLDLPDPTLWTGLAFDPCGRYLFVVGNGDRAIVAPLDGSRARRLRAWSEEILLEGAATSPSGRRGDGRQLWQEREDAACPRRRNRHDAFVPSARPRLRQPPQAQPG